VLGVSSARASVAGEGLVGGMGAMAAGRPRVDQRLEGDTPRGQEAAAHAMVPPGTSDAQADTAEARAAGWQPPPDDGQTQSAPRPRGRQLAEGASRRRG
jgi:hypothetical protein